MWKNKQFPRPNWVALAVLPGVLVCNLASGQTPAPGAAWSAVNTGLPYSSAGMISLAVDPSNSSALYAYSAKGGLFKSTDGAASWQAAKGLPGPSFLAIDPATSSTVYAAGANGIYKTTDAGASWSATNAGASNCTMVAIDPVTPATVYGLCGSGILKTADGGAIWKQIYSAAASSLVIDPTASSTIYASLNNADIIKSTDGGGNWTIVKAGISTNAFFLTAEALAIDPVTPSTLYAGSFAASSVSHSPGVPPIDFGNGSISRSTDGGQTWTAVRAGIPSDAFVESLAVNPASPTTIYAGYQRSGAGGILRSTDGGQNWTVVNSASFPTVILAIDPRGPATVYAAYSNNDGAGTIAKSDDSGSTWRPAETGLDFYNIRALAFDPASPASVYAGGASGLFKTVDAGGTWNHVETFQVAPTFIPNVGVSIVRSLLVDFKNPNTLYAETVRSNGCESSEMTFFKTTDRGATWNNSVSPPTSGCVLAYLGDSTVMAMDPSDPQTLYLSENDDDDGYYAIVKTTDGGMSWNSLWAGWSGQSGPQSDVNALAIDPITTTTVYAGLSSGAFKSVDGGLTWSASPLQGVSVGALAVDRTDPRTIYAGTAGGLLKSLDAGASWAAAGLAGVNLTFVVMSPNDANVIYAAGPGNGVYKSVDRGQSWAVFDVGLPNQNIQALVIGPGTPTTLYAATPFGVFKVVDAPVVTEAQWQQAIDTMKGAAGTDSLNFWQWAWYWQGNAPAFSGAPPGFGVAGSISPDLMTLITLAGGGDPLANLSAEQWVAYFRQVTHQ